ncbi:MAG: 1-deoxy-D-xylulose-5-phosphate synthase [Candidatus Omnitrophica bacterium]|nr:1-deoxy-D-xylulose-5-phosphate synthase [Candidatus Omnitrophota bacterium]
MRKAFIQTLVSLAAEDPRIVLLTGDLGYTVIEPFVEKFPDRFFNVGVAEQNMTGIATGLAEAGFIPFIYSIATFASLRNYEFIRNGPILHRLPVRIVGVGEGFEYARAGFTHHAFEDLGVLRVQPGITIISPADFRQAQSSLNAAWNLPGPVYFRLGKDDRTEVPDLNGRFALGRTQLIGSGSDLLLVTMGSVTANVAKAARLLSAKGVEATIAVVSNFNPSPAEDLAALLASFPLVLTAEIHYTVGGLGSLVSEIIAEKGLASRLVRCGIKGMPDGLSGSLAYLYEKHGLSDKALAETALKELEYAADPK